MTLDHPDWNCPNCRECVGCDGGSGKIPRNYKLAPFPGGKYATVRCTDCDGEGLLCSCECHVLVENR